MALLADILKESRGEKVAKGPSRQQVELANKSPLSNLERTAIGFENEQAQEAYLSKKFGADNVSKDPQTGKWQIYDEVNDVVRPVDEKGMSGGDITESVGKGLVSAVSVPSAIAGKIGVVAGPLGLPVTMGAAGALSGGAETIRQGIGNIIAGEPIQNIDKGEVARESIAGAIAPGIGAGLGKLGSMLGKTAQKATNIAGAEGLEQTEKQLAKGAKKIAQKEGTRTVDILKGNLEENTLLDAAKNKFVQKKLERGLVKQNLEVDTTKAANAFQKTIDDFPKMREKLYKSAGVTDSDKIPVMNAVAKIRTQIADLVQNRLTKEDDKAIADAMHTLGRIEKNITAGEMEYGQFKKLTNNLYKAAENNVSESGALTPIGRFYDSMGDALTTAKHEMPKLSKVSKRASELFQAEKAMKQLGRLNKPSGELRLYDRIANMAKKPTLQNEFRRIKSILESNPETKKYGDILNRVNWAMVANDISKAKAVTPQGLGRLPIVKYAANLISNPEAKMQTLSRMAKSGVIDPAVLEQRITHSGTPILSEIEAGIKARQALYGAPKMPNIKLPSMPKIPEPLRKLGNIAKQYNPLKVSPSQQIIRGTLRKVEPMIQNALPKFPTPQEQEKRIDIKLQEIRKKSEPMTRIADLYEKYRKGVA